MLPYGLVLTALLLAGGPLAARQQQAAPAAPAAPTPGRSALDGYLLRWEQEMQKVQTLAAQLARIDKDKTFQTTQKFVGYAQYMKSGTGPSTLNLAMLQMNLEGKEDVAE